jgi:hypothetical protein
MTPSPLADALDFTGALYLVRFHWFWMAMAFGLGAWVGWRTAAEAPSPPAPEDQA